MAFNTYPAAGGTGGPIGSTGAVAYQGRAYNGYKFIGAIAPGSYYLAGHPKDFQLNGSSTVWAQSFNGGNFNGGKQSSNINFYSPALGFGPSISTSTISTNTGLTQGSVNFQTNVANDWIVYTSQASAQPSDCAGFGGNLNRWKVTFGGGLWLAVSYNNTDVVSSTDGLNWTAKTAHPLGANVVSTIEYLNGKFFITGSGGQLASTTDGTSWATLTANMSSNNIWSMAYGNGVYVAVGAAGAISTSPDGVTWTARSSGQTHVWYSVAFGNGKFVAVGGAGGANNYHFSYSTDGVTWTSVATNMAAGAANTPRAVGFNGTAFMVCTDWNDTSNNGTAFSSSTDGVTWNTAWQYGGVSTPGNNLFSGPVKVININGFLNFWGTSTAGNSATSISFYPGTMASGGVTTSSQSSFTVPYSASGSLWYDGRTAGYDPSTGFAYTGSAQVGLDTQRQIPGMKMYGVHYNLYPAQI
jgi:hypothetical protein